MAELQINTGNILDNIQKLSTYLKEKGICWSLVTKVFSGDLDLLNVILHEDVLRDIHSIGDSRLSSVKNLKEVKPDLITIYIKPPAAVEAENVVRYADISANTSFSTIKALNKEAVRQNKIHKVIIMLELGELREGILRKNVVKFYKKVFDLSNIRVIGIGTNLGCMYGVEPTYDKLLQLVLYKQLLEEKFDIRLELVSGGSSITLPVLEMDKLPKGINHFRIGETAFFGTSPYDNAPFRDLSTETFRFFANIIELEEKDVKPEGVIEGASIGHISDPSENGNVKTYKGIMDFGILDVDTRDIAPVDKNVQFLGTTSDMTVYDLGDNMDKNGDPKYRVGNSIEFKANYMGVARLLNSKFIRKKHI